MPHPYILCLLAYLFMALACNFLIFKIDEKQYAEEFKKDYSIFLINAIFVYPISTTLIIIWGIITSIYEVIRDRIKR